MTPAEARAIVERHYRCDLVDSHTHCLECDQEWPCDAHRAATAYLASVAVVEAARRLRDWPGGLAEGEQHLAAALADVAEEVEDVEFERQLRQFDDEPPEPFDSSGRIGVDA